MAFEILQSRGSGNPAQTQRVKQWAIEIFELGEEVSVLVTELQCTEPGCPPLETVIAIMGVEKKQYKLHKALADVTHADVAGLVNGGEHS
ncbi:MAG: hypothetical protein FJ143_06975 [Deltaproteobacteria bacterium]|nr:hypothetical protein [Deltaproteobacteria bacterium]